VNLCETLYLLSLDSYFEPAVRAAKCGEKVLTSSPQFDHLGHFSPVIPRLVLVDFGRVRLDFAILLARVKSTFAVLSLCFGNLRYIRAMPNIGSAFD